MQRTLPSTGPVQQGALPIAVEDCNLPAIPGNEAILLVAPTLSPVGFKTLLSKAFIMCAPDKLLAVPVSKRSA